MCTTALDASSQRAHTEDVTEQRDGQRVVALAVEAIGQVVGGFRVRWFDAPYEGWDAMIEPDVECFCKGGCYCCDGASVTREQVEALRSIGVEVVDA